MDKQYKLVKTKCAICGKVQKKIISKNQEFDSANFIQMEDGTIVCKDCEAKYALKERYDRRGYGYKFSTSPKYTVMDKSTTPTFGIEIEVAGNIKFIDKINKLANDKRQPECSIGYDTSVEGAQFELSYAPGTYYWYLYESKLRQVCSILQKDPWVKKEQNARTIGMHVHIGNINNAQAMAILQIAMNRANINWAILRIAAEREFNTYCKPEFCGDHHDAISYSGRWQTIEFRIFKGTYDFNKIMGRLRFIRQIIDNLSEENGISWWKFKPGIKKWFLDLMEETDVSRETKEAIKLLFKRKPENMEDARIIEIAEHEWELKILDIRNNIDEYDEDEDEETEEEYNW